jgi:indolepyruvate ferredoxin oxidoreductase beta subunit
MVYNNADITFLILDNSWTCMTGHQPNPTTGVRGNGEESKKLNIEEIVKAIGVELVRTADAYDIEGCMNAIGEGIKHKGPSVVIIRRECALQVVRRKEKSKIKIQKDREKCIGCKVCIQLGCPAVVFKDGKADVDELLCINCGMCTKVCKQGAIVERWMNMKFSLIACGVGGQGSILSSRIIADAAIKNGYEVRVGETFGAAMRGGAVASHVKLGDIYSPLVEEDSADVILSMEPMESLRLAVKYLSPNGIVISDTKPWYPVDVNIGAAEYPSIEIIEESLLKLGKEVYLLDAGKLAAQAGHPKAANIVLIGALSALKILPVEEKYLLEAIEQRVPPKMADINIKAFWLGHKAVIK